MGREPGKVVTADATGQRHGTETGGVGGASDEAAAVHVSPSHVLEARDRVKDPGPEMLLTQFTDALAEVWRARCHPDVRNTRSTLPTVVTFTVDRSIA
ncbi:hypothetical protein GCM10027059_05970 [Myceligenerans halotolerans]